ncbi:helix-turn-helix transcriptional regulator [Ochrobactrum sp. LMG 5442]|nr:helix-turn-helix transcriptional regulator [Ochrobactrum sp. LMG 5442]
MKRERPSPLRQTLARNIRAQRERLGISQDELAFRADMHRTNVSAIERGLRNVSLDNLYFLATALETEPHLLIAEAK